ncbi:mCG1049012, partial [Mus musculus]
SRSSSSAQWEHLTLGLVSPPLPHCWDQRCVPPLPSWAKIIVPLLHSSGPETCSTGCEQHSRNLNSDLSFGP